MANLEKTILLYKGADTDTDIEISALEEGVYTSSSNMRSTHIGAKSARAKIGGESPVNLLTDDYEEVITDDQGITVSEPITTDDYVCIGGIAFDNYKILVFASPDPSFNFPFITINEEIMVRSPYLLFTYNHPVQCIATSSGGYITLFLNDKETTPLIFDINDIIDNYNSGESTAVYFGDFDINKYAPKLNIPLDVPKFSRIVSLSGSGLKAGKYSYQIRYVSDDGTGTAWSVPCTFIPVPGNEDLATDTAYAGESTFGRKGGTDSYYGIKLKIRVSNEFNYSFIELKRTSHYNGLEYESDPIVEKIKVNFDIISQPYATIDFVDSAGLVWEKYEATLEIDTQILSKAGAIRYFKGSFIIMNPTYHGKTIDSTDLFLVDSTYNNLAQVYLENIGDTGYGKIENQVNKLSLMRGEKYGWYVIAHDGSGGRSFAIPYRSGVDDGVDDFTNFQIPNRRVALGAQEEAVASGTMSDCATTSSGAGASHDATHEVFRSNPKTKTDSFINTCQGSAYKPFTPTGGESVINNINNRGGYNYEINRWYDGSMHHQAGFCNEIIAAGMRFTGIDISKFPDYIKAFSIVRTRPAGRVICQGLGFYALTAKNGDTEATKDLNSFWFMSPDIDPSYGITPGLFDEIINNPSRYKVQLVSPLGFHMEMYSPNDMAVYAEILYDNTVHNMDAAAAIGRADGYVTFGRWRNQTAAAAAVENSSDFIFDISSAEVNTLGGKNDRVQYLTLNFSSNLYASDGSLVASGDLSTDADVKNFHEPLYVVNIINTEATASTGEIISCIDTGHIQKLESVIGAGTGFDMKIYLVNERTEDCTSTQAGDVAFIEVEGNKWLDVTYDLFTSIEGWNQDLINNGYFTSGDVDYYGMYKHATDIDGTYLYFSWTEDVPAVAQAHTGANNATVLTDANATFVVNALVGKTIYNLTDGSSGVVVSNTATTVTTRELSVNISGVTNNTGVVTGYANLGGVPNTLEFYYSEGDLNQTLKVGDLIEMNGTNFYDQGYTVTAVGGTPFSFKIESADLGDPGVGGTIRFQAGGYSAIITHDNHTFPDGGTITIAGTTSYNGAHANIRWISVTKFAIAWSYLGSESGTCYGSGVLTGGENDWDTGDVYSVDYPAAPSAPFDYTIVPAERDRIVVKYNPLKPIVVFGGDTYISTAIAPFIDTKAEYAALVENSPDVFYLNKAFPNYNYKFVANYKARYLGHDVASFINTTNAYNVGYIRQMVALFTCESRLNLNLLYNDSFPKKHYVPRPVASYDTRFGDGAIAVYQDHFLNAEEYYLDYLDEYLYWLYGGFGIPTFSNKDYSRQFLPGRNFSKPQIGYVERVNFPNTIIYSLRRQIPGLIGALKAFPVENKYTMLADNYGEIVFAWDSTGDKGNNLYAITKKGVCLLLTDKNLLYSFTGEDIATVGGTSFIQAELWLPNPEGVDYDNWHTIAEYKDKLFMANSHGVFMVDGTTIADITDTFKKELDANLFPHLKGTDVSIRAIVDFIHKEYWLFIAPETEIELTDDDGEIIYDDSLARMFFTDHKIFVYDFENKKWSGMYEYNGELFISNDNMVYNVRGAVVYELDEGRIMNDNIVEGSITARISPEFGKECDFDRIKIFSDNKPSSVEFSDSVDLLPQAILSPSNGELYLKDYGFWTNKIPVTTDDHSRIQGRVLVIKVNHRHDEDFVIKSIGVKYRKLRAQ